MPAELPACLEVIGGSLRKAIPQFDVAKKLAGRPLERVMLHRGLAGKALRQMGRLTLTAMVWPRFVAPFRCRVARYQMPILGLPAAFENYRIAHISDLHTGTTRQRFLRQWAKIVSAEQPNMIVVTGDWIDYHPKSLDKLSEILPLLRATDGVTGIFGNHDYHEYSWRHVGARSSHRSIHKRLRRMLQQHGVHLLVDEARPVERSGERLWFVGLDEMWVGKSNPERAFARVPPGAACICLQHNPDGYPRLKSYPWQWMLCGHSHGGQVVLPIIGPLFLPMENRQWIRGLFCFPADGPVEKRMFVNRGVGYSTPLRMLAAPEIVFFTLRTSPGVAATVQPSAAGLQ